MTAGSDRLPPLPEAGWSEAQRREALEVIQGPRGALISPFVPLLRSPELMGHAQRMGEYLRYRSSLGLRLSEFAILLVAKEWSQQVEWTIHAPIAEREGVPRATIESIAAGERPRAMAADEGLVYDFVMELRAAKTVSDPTWAQAIELLGEPGVMDLTGIVGYYTFLAMVMNVARTPAPQSIGDSPPLVPPVRQRSDADGPVATA